MMFFRETGGDYIQWDPLTLKESGFFHLAMGAIIGVSAWTRGNEKLYHIGMGRRSRRNRDQELDMEPEMGYDDSQEIPPYDPTEDEV